MACTRISLTLILTNAHIGAREKSSNGRCRENTSIYALLRERPGFTKVFLDRPKASPLSIEPTSCDRGASKPAGFDARTIERKQFKMRNLKILGLAFVAMFAMHAIAATAASANELTAEEYTTILTGVKDPTEPTADKLVTTAGNVTCTNPTYLAELTKASTSVTVTPTYSGCTAFGFPAKVHMNGCSYTLTLGAAGATTSTAALACPAGNEVTITANPAEDGLTPKCIVHIKPQAVGGTVTTKNIGAGTTRELTLEINVSAIHYTHTEGTGLGKCTPGTGAAGVITAKAQVTGEKGGVHKGIFLSIA
jgi:hypothetical protein